MNMKEWKLSCSNDWNSVDHTFDYKSREIQKSLKYNPDPNATVRHHLMDTPEQIVYNKEHYEMWGHNLDGTFEYGKYMIFVTQEEHEKIHNRGIGHEVSVETREKISESLKNSNKHPWRGKKRSEETRQKMSISQKGHTVSDETREKISSSVKELWKDDEYKQAHIEYMKTRVGENAPHYGKPHSDDTKEKMSRAKSGEKNPNYGKHFSKEHREKISTSNKGKIISDETRKRMSESKKGKCDGENNPFYGKNHSEETKKKIIETTRRRKALYKEYIDNGGTLSYKEFIKINKDA